MCKRHMFSSYRVPLTAGLTPGYWQQPLKYLNQDNHWSLYSINPTSVTTVEVMLMHSLPMGSTVTKAKGHFSRHASINAIIHRSLAAVNVSSALKPAGLCRSECSIAM